MARSRKFLAAGAAGVAAVALIATGSGVTGAYFSDAKAGTITGTVGTIQVDTTGSFGTGTDHLNFNFENLMPGVAQTAVIKFKNTGTAPEDISLAFPNRTALHALNNLGRYGVVKIVDGMNNVLFYSTNLNDGRRLSDTGNTCGTFAQTVGLFDGTHCWPLPANLQVATNVAVGASGQVSFIFNYPVEKTDQGGVFNTYPVTEAFGLDAADTGNGLPFKVVANQSH